MVNKLDEETKSLIKECIAETKTTQLAEVFTVRDAVRATSVSKGGPRFST